MDRSENTAVRNIPRGPLGTAGAMRTPGDLQLGDLIEFDGLYYPIVDMQAARAGMKVLRFEGHPPHTIDEPILAYRAVTYTARSCVVLPNHQSYRS
ncbi:hypothetical protein [Streptomyces sp. NPDC015131]|uniref:hypothetical protein n=1 Tax=Streptomyces sp. NPDC015131 TaxID=3364941 RepID=UPI0036FE439B